MLLLVVDQVSAIFGEAQEGQSSLGPLIMTDSDGNDGPMGRYVHSGEGFEDDAGAEYFFTQLSILSHPLIARRYDTSRTHAE